MTASAPPRVPLLAVSLKAYLTARATRDWVHAVALEVGQRTDVEVAVLPSAPLLESTATLCGDSSVRWGAQDVAPSFDGAQTGAVTATLLVELGCTYAEVGHAERRRLFGESDATVARKLSAAAAAGLVPLLCVGEQDHTNAEQAAELVRAELARLRQMAEGVGPLVVAYEPIWAIGAPAPAPAEHVRTVVVALREELGVGGRIIYGGSAGVGTLETLWPHVDGLFLGRFAHDPSVVARLIDDAVSLSARNRSRHVDPRGASA